jgi:hypothetical protein
MTDMTLSSDSATPLNLRDSLIAQHGFVVGDAMYKLQLDARRKDAERLRGLQVRLDDLNAQIAARMREHDKELIQFTRRMDDSYQAWMRACEARDAKMIQDQGSLVELRNAAAALSKEINQPDEQFTSRVKNWSRPAGYVEEVALPPMPMVNGPR